MKIDLQENQRISYLVNTSILFLVLAMMVIYYISGAKFLVFYSIFVAAVYLLNFIFIKAYKLRAFVWSMYTMLTLYMAICTICLGYNYGFSFYSMSTIPLIYVIKYLAWRLKLKDPKPLFWTILISISCVGSALYSIIKGPVYNIGGVYPVIFLTINIISVCTFLFIFSSRMIQQVIFSHTKLHEQANFDALTGLANRYYIRNTLENLLLTMPPFEQTWVSILDIDNFKSINDTYGHNTGDLVLKALSKKMQEVCTDCAISRWGGEEFLICCRENVVPSDIIETLRQAVEDMTVQTPEIDLKFTITAGVSYIEMDQTIDAIISDADNKLYLGKNNGKNRVVY